MHEGIEDNVRLLIIEVQKQLRRTGAYLSRPSPAALATIVGVDDYIDNLKVNIQDESFRAVAGTPRDVRPTAAALRTLEVVAGNLEHIADFCEKLILKAGHVDRPEVHARHDVSGLLREVELGVDLIGKALFERDLRVAMSICQVEHTLDEMYAQLFQRILAELQGAPGDDTPSLVTLLFIAHYLERMGDALLNIGEAILSAQLGERVKLGRLWALEESLEPLGARQTSTNAPLEQLSLKAMALTRSGSRVNAVSSRPALAREPARPALIFKQGKTQKLARELDSVTRWQTLVPGLAPHIYSFQHAGEDGALLFEYLPGHTFESVLIRQPWRQVVRALEGIQDKLAEVWARTRTPVPVAPRFLEQLSARLDDVLAAHPELRRGDARIGHKSLPSFRALIERLLPYDELLEAPFSVFIHGDFNADNVIYDATDGSVRFIDLHRSAMTDYVQDISVFLVSQFRLQFLTPALRRRVRATMLRFFSFAKSHALRLNDPSFDQRLALGLARSFATSTRFVLDPKLSRSMFLRSRYLLERLAEPPEAGRARELELSREVLVA